MNFTASTETRRNTGQIKLYAAEHFEGMRKAGRIAALTLDMLTTEVKPGVTTAELDTKALEFMLDHGAEPATVFYRGYRHSSCTSIDNVICHGIPNDKALKDGQIVNIDVTAIVNGYHGDTSRMFLVGDVPLKARRLVDVTYEAMMRGIATLKHGSLSGDLGHAIQSHAESHGYGVVRDFCGHGVGLVFHDAPNILHYGQPGRGLAFREGMFFTVEPMINAGKPNIRMLDDGWTAVTRDRSLSAQFEHTIGVTSTGVEIFTASPADLHKPPYA